MRSRICIQIHEHVEDRKIFKPTIEHAVCYRATWYNGLIDAVILVGSAVLTGALAHKNQNGIFVKLMGWTLSKVPTMWR